MESPSLAVLKGRQDVAPGDADWGDRGRAAIAAGHGDVTGLLQPCPHPHSRAPRFSPSGRARP